MIFLSSRVMKFVLGLFLIPSLLLLYQNQSSNKHTHILPNGEIIEHSHPYDKSESDGSPNSHGHDALDFIFIGQLSDNEPDNLGFCPQFVDFSQSAEVIVLFLSGIKKDFFSKSNPSRGPPSPLFV